MKNDEQKPTWYETMIVDAIRNSERNMHAGEIRDRLRMMSAVDHPEQPDASSVLSVLKHHKDLQPTMNGCWHYRPCEIKPQKPEDCLADKILETLKTHAPFALSIDVLAFVLDVTSGDVMAAIQGQRDKFDHGESSWIPRGTRLTSSLDELRNSIINILYIAGASYLLLIRDILGNVPHGGWSVKKETIEMALDYYDCFEEIQHSSLPSYRLIKDPCEIAKTRGEKNETSGNSRD